MSDYGHDLQFGVFITPSNGQPDRVVSLAQAAELAGLDLVTFQDHPYQSSFLDTWTLLSFVAARTERVKLSPNVLNLPLRPPSVVARAAASLDLLSGGRVELGMGAGGFWDAIAAMGGRRLKPGESVEALEEAIAIIRSLWDTSERRGVTFEGRHYSLAGAARGPAPAHPIGIWLGAYKPRMLRLTGRVADGWLPSLSYLEPGQLGAGNSVIDEAAVKAGRDPRDIRRLLNITGTFSPAGAAESESAGSLTGPPAHWVQELTRLALEEGIGTFIVMADDPATIRIFGEEIAPAVRERVAAGRTAAPDSVPEDDAAASHSVPEVDAAASDSASVVDAAAPDSPQAAEADLSDQDRLGIKPTPDDGTRHSSARLWDESTRPSRPQSGPDVTYSERGRQAGQHLIDVHDNLRKELEELRGVIAQVRDGALTAGEARSALNDMALRQNDWTLGAFCSRYCRAVAQHHSLEDVSVFPHLASSDERLQPVIDRLTEEHHVIHDAIEAVDKALVDHINNPEDFTGLQEAVDVLTDTLLSHLSYEEHQLVEPLARLGFYPNQI